MSDQIQNQLKSFVLGVALPVFLAVLALSYMDGGEHRTPRGRLMLTPAHAFGYGLMQLGMALCIHAVFCEWYANRPRLRLAVAMLGVAAVVTGLFVRFY